MKQYFYIFLISTCLCACTSETKIVEEMDQLKISKGNYELTAKEIKEMDSSFMIVGWGRLIGDHYIDASISCIPIDRVESLREKYGNFRRCANPGSAVAKRSSRDIELILANKSSESIIKQLEKIKKDHLAPIININGRQVHIESMVYKDTPHIMTSHPETLVIVDNITIEREDYAF